MAHTGELLRRFRVRALLTQEELAARTGLSERTIRRIEAGVLRPRATSIRLISEALRLSTAEQERLADGDEATLADRSRAVVPRQLPMDVAGFVGREKDLKQLDDMLIAGRGRTPLVSVISGTAGVGKTALAVHWAHRVAAEFPDGQLYVDLAGFDPVGPPLTAGDAVRGFLEALGVPPLRIPTDLDSQRALYRSALADLRVLVVLDNARDTGQVRKLLPGAPSCRVVVTSRNELTGLVAADGAQALVLDLLSQDEARSLMHTRLGPQRANADGDAVDMIVDSCARLPLALSIVAARAAMRPARTLRSLAIELVARGLDPLSSADGDARSDVRTVLSWSYQDLTSEAARAFRLLGLHPGPDFPATAAASLLGGLDRDVRPLLAELTRTSLLAERAGDRYAYHDLLRMYANEQARTLDTEGDRRTALRRMTEHYLHTALAAVRRLDPYRTWLEPPEPAPGVTLDEITNEAGAAAWFRQAHPALVACVDLAASYGLERHASQLAWVVADYFDPRAADLGGLLTDFHALFLKGLAAAERAGDQTTQARLHRALGHACSRLGRHAEAHEYIRRAILLASDVGDHREQAAAHHKAATMHAAEGDLTKALEHARSSMDAQRRDGDAVRVARSQNGVGWYHALRGELTEALEHCRSALPVLRQAADSYGEANTWDSLGYIHHQLGDYAQAVTCYRHSAESARLAGSRYREAGALTGLGHAYAAAGADDPAHDAWLAALDILDDLDHPDADDLRSQLKQLQQ